VIFGLAGPPPPPLSFASFSFSRYLESMDHLYGQYSNPETLKMYKTLRLPRHKTSLVDRIACQARGVKERHRSLVERPSACFVLWLALALYALFSLFTNPI
jgi:hypothetical protein